MQKWFMSPANARGPRYYRQELPLKHLLGHLKGLDVKVKFSTSMADAMDADACFFSRNVGASNLAAILQLKWAGKFIVWDCDDDLTIPDRWVEPDKEAVRKEILAFLTCLDLADMITVSTEPLRQALGYPDKTVVLPNMIDLDHWPIDSGDPNGGKLRVLYAGSNTHHRDLDLVEDLYRATSRVLEWVFFGLQPRWATRSATCIPLTTLENYPKLCRLLKPDVALAPLEPCRFNQSKSAIKVWEMATISAAVVASDVGPYCGHPAAIVPPGQPFTEAHLNAGASRWKQSQFVAEKNSWQYARGERWWRETFGEIASMVRDVRSPQAHACSC